MRVAISLFDHWVCSVYIESNKIFIAIAKLPLGVIMSSHHYNENTIFAVSYKNWLHWVWKQWCYVTLCLQQTLKKINPSRSDSFIEGKGYRVVNQNRHRCLSILSQYNHIQKQQNQPWRDGPVTGHHFLKKKGQHPLKPEVQSSGDVQVKYLAFNI